jgi:hypothetical protein
MSERREVLYDCAFCGTEGADTRFCEDCVAVTFAPVHEVEELRAKLNQLREALAPFAEEAGRLLDGTSITKLRVSDYKRAQEVMYYTKEEDHD